MVSRKLSDFAPGEVMIFLDGERIDQPGRTKVTMDWPEGEKPWISITTDPDDQSYRNPKW